MYLCLKGNGVKQDLSWTMTTQLDGVSWTPSTGEFPKDAVDCSLLSILQTEPPTLEKYYLSQKACKGILRRAKERGKELPPILQEALEEVVNDGEECLSS